jgi:hypothetical protein
MWLERDELLYDLLTRDAILIKDRQIFQLDGPFDSREQALEAARQVEARVADRLENPLQAVAA